jgi:hypothetical protein
LACFHPQDAALFRLSLKYPDNAESPKKELDNTQQKQPDNSGKFCHPGVPLPEVQK